MPTFRSVVAATAAAAVLGVPASAGAVQNSTLNYQCKYPLIGIKALKVDIALGIPDTWPTSTPTDPFSVVATASAYDMAAGLQAVDDLTSIDGASTAFASVLTAQGYKVPAKTVATIENTILPDPVPDPLVLTATGSTPALTFDEPGVEKITLDRLAINLTARDSAGDPIVLPPVTKDIDGNKVSDSDGDSNTFDVYCKLDAGQDTTIGSFEIVEPGSPTPTPTTAPTPTPAPTTAPTPTPAPTTAPTPTPAPTTAPPPTPAPTTAPTPTPAPTTAPSPTPAPTTAPSPTPAPTTAPSPTPAPTTAPSPTPAPTTAPSPTPAPTTAPSPTPAPTTAPSPTPAPTTAPSPTPAPTTAPTPTPAPTTGAPKVRGVIGNIGYANIGGISIVTGSNLGGGKVTVGDKPAPVLTQLGGSILVVALPPLPKGKYPLVVTNDAGSSAESRSTTIKYIPLFRWMW